VSLDFTDTSDVVDQSLDKSSKYLKSNKNDDRNKRNKEFHKAFSHYMQNIYLFFFVMEQSNR